MSNARARSKFATARPASGVTDPDWTLLRAQHYREAHSHPDKENVQIVSISPAPVDGSLSETKQF
jgi:hypothetical protein